MIVKQAVHVIIGVLSMKSSRRLLQADIILFSTIWIQASCITDMAEHQQYVSLLTSCRSLRVEDRAHDPVSSLNSSPWIEL